MSQTDISINQDSGECAPLLSVSLSVASDIFPLGGDVAGWVAFAPDLSDDALGDLRKLLETDPGASGDPL